ncbi:MAG TPA: VTT domain-containing protein [Bryobacteraceae bacterium]|nr:VTT domain-containing protein [Bryobacteraceae bacterium]
MFSIRNLLLHHGYLFLFAYILAVQIGVPIPADPLLLLMGALVGNHLYQFWSALGVAVLAAVLGDYMWYELGRWRGKRILALLCKLSLEPDTCVRKTEAVFGKRGAAALLFVKFVPGMGLVSMPLAGMVRMERWRFLLADVAGAFLWSGTYLLAGWVFHRQVDAVVVFIGLFGRRAGLVVAYLLALYIAYKYFQRWRFMRELRINRITPNALKEMMSSGCAVTVIDLRHPAEIEREGLKLAGARVIRPDELKLRSAEIPRGHEIVLYCTCPNEATSARVAMQLRKAGIRRVRPLEGGLDAWRALGYPLEEVTGTVKEDHLQNQTRADVSP